MSSPAPQKKRLGDLLLEEGLIDRYQLQAALAEQKKWGGRLGKHLIELGILSEEVLVKVLSKLLNLPSVDVGRLTVPKNAIEYVPVKTAEKFNLVPIGIEELASGKKTLIVAMADPTNLAALDELRFTSGCAVRPVVSGDSSIERAIRTYYYGGQSIAMPGTSRTRTNPGGAPQMTMSQVESSPEMVIMSKGEAVTFRMDADGGGPVPQAPPDLVGSLPASALTPVPSFEAKDENGRRLNALLRVLLRRKILTEEEFLAELAKG
jgi:hypothetical protein